MRIIQLKIMGLVFMASLVFSCDNTPGIQQFIIDHQDNAAVIAFDVPGSILSLETENQTPENLEVLKSIKKANVLVYKIDNTNKQVYQKEKHKLQQILKQKKYTELMRYGKASQGAKVVMLGNENSIDELLVFANDDAKGWLLIRILGKNMQPEKIMGMLKQVNFDTFDDKMGSLKDLLKNR